MERRGQQDNVRHKATPAVHRGEISVPQAYVWLKVAGRNRETQFNNLLHQISVPLLRCAYQMLGKSKASGVDRVTKAQYGKELETNLEDLHARIHRGSYHTQPARIVHIPKTDGRLRPIAISTIEDKIVQGAVAMVLEAIYETVFSDSSLGFRPKRGCHKAIKRVFHLLKGGERKVVIDVDIEKFFNSMNHDKLLELMGKRIVDKRFLRLIWKLLKAQTRDGKENAVNEVGSPQGSVASPILANIYLHYVLDEWFEEHWANHHRQMVRYADDVIFCFKQRADAEEFLLALRERMSQGHLRLNDAKTKIVSFAKEQHEVFHFLGFTFYWGKDRKRNTCLKLKTEAQKFRAKVLEFKLWIQQNRSRFRLKTLWNEAKAKLHGHYAYYAVHYNHKTWHYYHICLKLLMKWLNRRSQKRSFSWNGLMKRLKINPLPKPYMINRVTFEQDVFAFAL